MQDEKQYAVAVDLGGTNLACAIAARDCSIIRRTINAAGAGLGSERIIANIEKNIADLIHLSEVGADSLAGIGVGAPGIVHADQGIVHRAANFPRWQDVPLGRILEERFSLPAFVRHDVDMATLAEKHYGAGRGKDHVVCITVGTGIGMGMILNGRLYRGSRAGAGNLGHMIIDKDVAAADDSGGGYLESLAAGPAIRARALEAVRQGKDSLLRELCGGELEKIDARMVFEGARQGDGVSARIVRETVYLLGIGVANVINLLSPEIVIVSGGVALAGEILFAALIESVRDHVCAFLRADVDVVPAELGDSAGLVGAAHTVWECVEP